MTSKIVHSVLDLRIARLAARQFGLVTRVQLLELGLGTGAIQHRINTGWLIPVYAGVYAVGYVRSDPPAQAMAAVLACGQGACLSFSSAAFLWDITKRWFSPPEVTVPGYRSPQNVRVHRSRTLSRRDARHHRGIRMTSPARTVLDLTPRLSDRQLARAVNDARLNARLRPEHLAELIERNPNHAAVARLRPFAAITTGPTRSDFEDFFGVAARLYNLPSYEVNAIVQGMRVDVWFPTERVIVELDSWEFHQDRTAFQTDRERSNRAIFAGIPTVRLTWERLTEQMEEEMARLNQLLADRRRALA
jgi:very-short-patch-repair endonuclease